MLVIFETCDQNPVYRMKHLQTHISFQFNSIQFKNFI